MLPVFLVVAAVSHALAGPVIDLSLVDQLQRRLDNRESPDTVFNDFKIVFNKQYENEAEEKTRLAIFTANVAYIDEHNTRFAKGNTSYTIAVNKFADLTHKEFLLQYTTSPRPAGTPRNGSMFMAPAGVQLPTAIDWRTKGYVTQVKDQGQCGSCWTFSTTGALEGQLFRKTRRLVSLSEQQLLDCSVLNDGCDGGDQDVAFNYIRGAGGLEREVDYSYKAKEGQCVMYQGKLVPGSRVTGFVDVVQGSEISLHQAVGTVGPVSISIDASQKSFQFYKSGVYYEPMCSSVNLNHAVLAAGYGTHIDGEYWLVKNSWGTSWGDEGYIKMARNFGNNCGVASGASYPLL